MLNKSRSAVLQPGILSNVYQTGSPSALTCQPEKQKKRGEIIPPDGSCVSVVCEENAFKGRNKLN